MKKRIFAGLLLAFMLILSAVPVFAAPVETATTEAATNETATTEAATNETATTEAATGETATTEAATNETATTEVATPEKVPVEVVQGEAAPIQETVAPEKLYKDGTAFKLSEIKYDNDKKTISLTLKNTSKNTEFLGFIVLDYKEDAMNVPLNNQAIADETVVKHYGVEIENGVAIQIMKELDSNATETVTFDVEIPDFDANKNNLPLLTIGVLTETISTTTDLTEATAKELANSAQINYQKFENAFGTAEKTPGQAVSDFVNQTGFSMLAKEIATNWKLLVMILISLVLMYLAIVKKFEPLLLLPIAFGMLLTNLPGIGVFHEDLFAGGHVHWEAFGGSGDITPGLIDYLYLGVKLGIYPCLIFFGVGAMTDFGPLIANPKSLLLGAAAQLGIFITYLVCVEGFDFTALQAASTGIIGGADGPTAIFVTSKLAPELLGPIAVAAYSYMALVPVIQPPIMKALTTKKERQIVMKPLREVSKTEKIIFPIVVTIFVSLLVPSAGPLVGSLMLGNLVKECGVTERLSKTMQNELMNIVTIFLGISVGATATAATFLAPKTLIIVAVGVVAFGVGSAGGVLLAKFMNLFTKNKINPLMGSAGVSAVPMAARVSQTVGQKENPQNFLLMHAMGPNVAGVIGSAIAAGVLIALFG